jgi:hypothetical protein
MTGSVGITGSLSVNGVSTLSGALTGTSATFSGNVIFDTTDRGIVSNTTDGADNKFVSINGGGARGSDRGGTINLFGNEATGTGRIDINAGDVVGGVINLVTAGLNRLTVNRDGSTTLAGALSGTSATFSSTGNAVTITSSSSASNVQLKVNNGVNGDIYAGVAASDGSSVFTGTTAYSGYIGTNISVPFYIAAGGTVRLTIASTGAATFSGQVKIPASSYLEWNSRGGIAQDGSFNFNWSTNGVANAFHLQSSTGNVGIGTTSPVGTLHISNASPIFNIDDTSTTGTLKRFRLTSGDIGTTQTALFSFSNSDATSTGNTNVMVLNELGNVGIGTTSPLQTLTLAGTQMMYNTGGDGVANVVLGSITSQVRSYGTGIATSSFASIQFATDPTTWYKGDIRFLTNGTDGTSGAGTERMRITSDGSLLIGTSSITNTSAGRIINRTSGTSNPDSSLNNGSWTNASIAVEPAFYLSSNVVAVTGAGGSSQTAKGGIGFEYYSPTSPTELSIGIFGTPTVASNLRFWNTTERMRITSGGTVLIGKTSSDATVSGCELSSTGAVFTRNDDALLVNRQGSDGAAITIRRSNTTVGTISVTTTATAYNTSSDYRLKQDLKEYIGLDLISAIKTYNYEWKTDSTRAYGVLAHELQEVLPQAVYGEKDAEEMQGVDYSKLVPIMIKAIQEQQAQIEELKLLIK